MHSIVIPIVAFFVSGLTLFSGFGLGTLLMPVFALSFPVELAIAMTAVVHLANNVFKGGLLGRHADRGVVLRFGLPAVASAFAGAGLLVRLSSERPLFAWDAFGRDYTVTPLGLVVGIVILAFVALERSSRFATLALDSRWLPLGGVVSGFFGGLSGHQGAFRSLFLLRAGLDKQAYVATGALVAILVDLARTAVYGLGFLGQRERIDWSLVGSSALAAFAGAYLAARWLEKTTLEAIRALVTAMLVVVALALVSGLLAPR